MTIDRDKVLSPTQASEIIPKLEARLADTERAIASVDRRSPPFALDAEIGPLRWLQLQGARGTWSRSPDEQRQGEVANAWREKFRLQGEAWRQRLALEEARRQAAAYTAEHAEYDRLAEECDRLGDRVEYDLLRRVREPGPVPASVITAYGQAARELQARARVLLRLSGHRERWGRWSEMAPEHRLSPSSHRQVIEQLLVTS